MSDQSQVPPSRVEGPSRDHASRSRVAVSSRRWLFLADIAWRESRTARRRLLLYMSSISLGVGALVAIDSYSKNVTRSVHEQSRALLGGDIAITSNQPAPKEQKALLDSLAAAGIGETRSMDFVSMAVAPQPRGGATRLVQVHAVAQPYPFFGEIVTAPAPAWSQLWSGHNVVVDPALLVSLDMQLGDSVGLGYTKFKIIGTLESVPGDVGISAAIGPRVYIPEQYVSATGLLVFGSRADYETLIKLPANLSPAQFVGRFGPRFGAAGMRTRTAGSNESRLADSIQQLHDFLSIVGLVALLLGGIGVASGVHAFVMRKIDPVAVLRCLGATSWQVLLIYTAQAAVMGLAGAAIGVLLGVGIQFALPAAAKDFLPVDVKVVVEPFALLIGLGIGLWVALVFALRPLVALRGVSPLQTLRRDSDADALRRSRLDPLGLLVTLAIVASVIALSVSRANTTQRGIGFAVAIGTAIAVLWAVAAALSWTARHATRPSWPFPLRQGIASLHRPGNQTQAVVLALGFGVFLIGTLYQVQDNLLRSLNGRLSEARANLVFFDVQESQRAGIDSIIRGGKYELLEETPLIPMRIAAINGRRTSQILGDTLVTNSQQPRAHNQLPSTNDQRPDSETSQQRRGRGSWALRREFRSTYRDTLVASERLVAGKWFDKPSVPCLQPQASPHACVFEVSLDRGVANELRVGLGDTVTWSVQGVEIPTRVTSLREVAWASFEPNFFAVFQPAALAKAPKQFIILTRASTGTEVARLQRAVVAKYPGVSSLDLTLVQQTIRNVLGKVSMAIRFLALICFALGIPVLFSAVAATRRERLREGVLLKTLGATKQQVGRIMLAEYALLGGLGALTGVVLSSFGAWSLLHWIFRQPFLLALGPALLVSAAMIVLAVLIGLLTGRDVFASTPMAALREV